MSHGQLRIWPALAGAKIAPELYGHQMEMVGRSIYDGIWAGRASRSANEDGIRLDVLALLKHLRVPLLKWPGDDFANYYHWRDGVANGEERPHRVNVPWQQIEPNSFGLHEFMGLCEKLDCKPWVTCNGLTGSLDEALAWVEYATFGGDTDLCRERSHNGSPDPFDIPIWSVGGESTWPVRSLALINPDITIVDSNNCAEAIGIPEAPCAAGAVEPGPPSLCAIRHYFRHGPGHGFGKEGYENVLAGLRDFENGLKQCIAGLKYRHGDRAPAIALQSWGAWHDEATAENGLEQSHTLRDGLLAASVYNVLNQQAAHVKVAAMAHAVNALQCLAVTQGSDMYLTPTYHVADMMRYHRGARLVTQRLETPDFEVRDPKTGAMVSIPALSVSASRTGKRVCITAVNRCYSESMPLSVEIREASVSGLTGRLLHASAATAENSFDNPKQVAPTWLTLTPDGNTFHDTLPPHSMATYMVVLGQG